MNILCLRYMEGSDTYSNFRGGSRMTCDRVRFFQKAYFRISCMEILCFQKEKVCNTLELGLYSTLALLERCTKLCTIAAAVAIQECSRRRLP